MIDRQRQTNGDPAAEAEGWDAKLVEAERKQDTLPTLNQQLTS